MACSAGTTKQTRSPSGAADHHDPGRGGGNRVGRAERRRQGQQRYGHLAVREDPEQRAAGVKGDHAVRVRDDLGDMTERGGRLGADAVREELADPVHDSPFVQAVAGVAAGAQRAVRRTRGVQGRPSAPRVSSSASARTAAPSSSSVTKSLGQRRRHWSKAAEPYQ